MSSPRSSISQEWIPARTSMPNERTASVMAWAQRTARPGPSNVARTPVSGGVDLTAAVPFDLPGHNGVVSGEGCRPASIPETRCVVCRPDDVGEQHRGENTVEVVDGRLTGEELLDGATRYRGLGRRAWDETGG